MTTTARRWPNGLMLVLMSSIGLVLGTQTIALSLPLTARAATNAECDSTELNNVFGGAIKDSVRSPYITWAQATISYTDYALCHGQGGSTPRQSSSSAWISIDGPQSDEIVQIGLIKCNPVANVCGNHMDQGFVDWFYAFGRHNDPFYMPWANKILLADTSTHTYTVFLSNGTWHFQIGGMDKKTLSDSWRSWHATATEETTELHNEGDQMGGTAAHPETFRSAAYKVGSGSQLFNDYSDPGQTGHCYPWARFTVQPGSGFDVWTSDPHTDC